MHLLDLPDELLLQIIEHLKLAYPNPPDTSPTRFHDWTEQSGRYLSCLDDICRDLLSLSNVCKRLFGLAYTLAYETVTPKQWVTQAARHGNDDTRTYEDDDDGDADAVSYYAYYAAVKHVYAGDQTSLTHLHTLPSLQGVTLHAMSAYSSLFSHQKKPPPRAYTNIHHLQCINCSLGLSALHDLFAIFPNLTSLHYSHGIYTTLLNSPRRTWSAQTFTTALALHHASLQTLILTREPDALLNGHRAQHPAHIDLRALEQLQVLRVAEVFLFCKVQIQHHCIEDLSDRLPCSIRDLAVFYDEPGEVRFEWEAPPGLETSVESWPRWPLGLAQSKLSGRQFGELRSVVVLERARPMPLKFGHLDDDHDGLAPLDEQQQQHNRILRAPSRVAEACDMALMQLEVLVNVGGRGWM